MNFSDYKAMTFRRDGRVLNATFDRAETMNAFDDDLHADFLRLFDDVAKDRETNVLVITGAGRAFSAGGNIEEMQRAIQDPELFRVGVEIGKKHIMAILDCPKPVIAKVNGPAIGLGATMALFCDIVIASKKARIADPHVLMGLSAGDGGSMIWPALIGYARAKVHLFTGDPLTGEEAERVGLVHRAVDPEELDQVTDELAQRIAAGASRAIQLTKLSVNLGLKNLVAAAMDQQFAWEMESQRTTDHQEAVNAFRERRTPNFTGE